MNITVFDEKTSTKNTLSFTGSTVRELLQHININPETVLVVRNNEVVTEDSVLEENDALELLSVISGG